MTTRSIISAKFGDQIVSTYLHNGGEEQVNNLLLDFYQTEDEVKELLGEGDLSSLAETPEACDAYHKRGEAWENIKPVITKHLNGLRPKLDRGLGSHFHFDGAAWTYNGRPLKRTYGG
ncbi:hypothetical protein SCOR_15240 [Sulfidibacter corallicola]|uniref:Uncharacterized protein n=1 Tax=Sulfidibacter corallicola TaxID=2818388 RepID=A0A8A4TXW7_SULCO|nr:hypothetical protein [Sulfidibacter corallicola]QTD54177.1 hypothetical protein J3U87_17160 [Sulfidibacter corallicola]